jgi:hypothetical protein
MYASPGELAARTIVETLATSFLVWIEWRGCGEFGWWVDVQILWTLLVTTELDRFIYHLEE